MPTKYRTGAKKRAKSWLFVPLAPLPRLYLQRNFSMSVNSAAVLRLTGRGGGPIAGAPRGRSTSRGRGKNLTNVIHGYGSGVYAVETLLGISFFKFGLF